MELQHLAEVSRNEAIVFGHRLSLARAHPNRWRTETFHHALSISHHALCARRGDSRKRCFEASNGRAGKTLHRSGTRGRSVTINSPARRKALGLCGRPTPGRKRPIAWTSSTSENI